MDYNRDSFLSARRTSIRPELQNTLRPELKTRAAMRFSHLLQMSEKDVNDLARILEGDPLFQKFFRAVNPNWKVFSRKSFPQSRLSQSFWEWDEQKLKEFKPADIQTLLLDKEELVSQIRAIGRENFERYFLQEEEGKTEAETAAILSLSVEAVQKIRKLAEDIALAESSFSRQNSQGAPSLRFTKIAQFRKKENGIFEIHFFPLSMAQGIYKIDYEKLRNLKKEGILDPKEKKSLQETIKFLELINARRNLIYRILNFLPLWQKDFFKDENWDRLLPLTQKSAARQLNMTPAAVCRALRNRSVVLDSGRETALSDFFPSKKEIQKRKIALLLRENPGLSDDKIRKLAQEKLGIALSRRSVNVYRNELMAEKKI